MPRPLLPPVSLEDLVAPDHFYRHLERSLDLGFVRELVRDAYCEENPRGPVLLGGSVWQ
jgi:hypothetical protein